MKFKNYLNEGTLTETRMEKEIIKSIKSDCKPYLNDLIKSGARDILYSGRKENKTFLKKDVRKNRTPLNTNINLHNKIDDIFYEKFKVRPRSESLFCSPNTYDPASYGTPYIVFPIGKYKIIWSDEISDLFTRMSKFNQNMPETPSRHFGSYHFNGILWTHLIQQFYSGKEYTDMFIKRLYNDINNSNVSLKDVPKDFKKEWIKKITDQLDVVFRNTLHKYRENDIENAIESNNEIMLVCDKVYLLNFYELENFYSHNTNEIKTNFFDELGLKKWSY